MHLGEADCGIVVWIRAERDGIPILESARQSCDAYAQFVDSLVEAGFRTIVITGATYPTISDADQLGEVVMTRRNRVKATQSERTALTRHFNALLRSAATHRGMPFVDIADHAIDSNTGLVMASLHNKDPSDHHMDAALASVFWTAELRPALEVLDPVETALDAVRLVANRRTFIKAIEAQSGDLAPFLKHGVAAGDVLEARVCFHSGKTMILSSVRLNGTPLSPVMRIL
jgi:hypothetical protein